MNTLDDTLRELGIPEYINEADLAALVQSISGKHIDEEQISAPHRLPRLAFLYETQGILTFQREITRRGESNLIQTRQIFKTVFSCWKTLLSLPDTVRTRLYRHELPGEILPTELGIAFRVAVSGLMSGQVAEIRLELRRFDILALMQASGWRDFVLVNVFGALILLARKNDGWSDINTALLRIEELRQYQKSYEDDYLTGKGEQLDQTVAALELLGLYHLAQIVTLTGDYLRDGGKSTTWMTTRLDRHRDQAVKAFKTGDFEAYSHLADLLWMGCIELIQNSIWTHVTGLGEDLEQFGRLLIHDRPNPVIELWPGQQKALRSGLFDAYPRAILIEAPTSAGKTLLAKFLIVQTKALVPHGKIAYIVPTRALVNQITLELRADFHNLKKTPITVEQAVPAFELDPTEERLLQSDFDILVTTPEKLDLLIRSDHPAVTNLSLIIADEAHNIRDGDRGARLELLLGTIKRDKPGARFLLLSPFIPNPEELLLWLGEDRYIPPIQVEWRPSRKIVGAVSLLSKKKQKSIILETLPSVDNTGVPPGLTIPLASSNSLKKTIKSLTGATVTSLLERGSMLILCYGPGTSITRAKEIAEGLDVLPPTENREAVCRYLETEIGRSSDIVELIRRGVAYHHSGMSPEARWLIEVLVRQEQVNVICGTTTLAQGVNFPISTVVIETMKKGANSQLNYQDFWNTAGRAGRTLVDTVGIVALPVRSDTERDKWQNFLKGEAEKISSQLAELIKHVDEIGDNFSVPTLYKFPQLSSLLQFLAHAMRVSGSIDLADEVEDLLRASLIFHQARSQSDELVERLVRLCRRYLLSIKSRRDILALADQTGFATPTVFNVMAQTRNESEFAEPDNWLPERLFGDDIEPMQRRIEVIADLPEIELGQTKQPPFSSRLVAEILRDWVNGKTLSELAANHLADQESDPEKRITLFSKYLFSTLLGRASWGLGALEAICLPKDRNDTTKSAEESRYVPSMVYFGVPQKEAVWMRMVGVPRVVATSLGSIWNETIGTEPKTYSDLRAWIGNLSDEQWQRTIPQGSKLTPKDLRILWQNFTG